MAATTNVQVVINAKDAASGVIKSLEKQINQLGKSVDNVGKDFANMGKAVVAGAAGLVALATKAAFSAARVEELGFALEAVAKANDISTDAAYDTVEALRGMNIAHQQALQITAQFIQAQLDLADATKVANAAKDLAVIAGLDSSEATETLTTAILTQRPLLLRQFGIVKTMDQIYEDYAKTLNKGSSELVVNTKKTTENEAKLVKLKNQLQVANLRMGEFSDKTKESTRVAAQFRVDELSGKIASLEGHTTAYAKAGGTASKNLTELEKRQAFLNVILEQGERVAGTYDAAMGSVSKRFRSLTGRIIPDFLAKIGKAFSPALTVVIDAITNAIEDLTTWIDENQDKVAEWGKRLGEAATKGIEILQALVTFLVDNKEILLGIFVAMAAAVGILAVGFVAAHAAFFAIITAIVALVTLLAKAWNENFLKIKEGTEALIDVVETVFNGIKAIIESVSAWLQGTGTPLFEEWFTSLKEKFDNFVETVKTTIDQWVEDMIYLFTHLHEAIAELLGIMVGVFVGSFEEMTGVSKEESGKWPGIIKSVMEKTAENHRIGFEKLVEISRNNLERIVQSYKDFLPQLPDIAQQALDSAKSVFEVNFGLISKVVTSFVDTTVSNFHRVRDAINEMIDAFKRGFSLGRGEGLPGFQTGGVVPGPIGAPTLAKVHAGERVLPAGVDQSTGGGGGGGVTFNVSIGLYAGAETEKRQIGKELYAALVRTATAQNKTVSELMGG